MKRVILADGVRLTILQSAQFKNAMLSVSLLDNLDRENNTKNALLPTVLKGGCEKYPDSQALNIELEELYGAELIPLVRKKGETQTFGFALSFLEGRYALNGEEMLERATSLLFEVLLKPKTADGGFDESIMALERNNLKDRIAAMINDKREYAIVRCYEEMCKNQPFALHQYGQAEDVDKISGRELLQHYFYQIRTCPMELTYVGSEEPEKVEQMVGRWFAGLKREPKRLKIPRLTAPVAAGKEVTDRMEVSQCKLTLGFNTGVRTDEKEYFPLVMMNAVFGGGPTSKLFLNVREKMSLCYYAASRIEKQKGILVVYSGIEQKNREVAIQEILNQLDQIRAGNITDEELDAAKRAQKNAYRSIQDSPYGLEDFLLGESLCPLARTVDQYIQGIEGVTKEQIAAAAGKVALDTIYTLCGKEEQA